MSRRGNLVLRDVVTSQYLGDYVKLVPKLSQALRFHTEKSAKQAVKSLEKTPLAQRTWTTETVT